MQDFALLATAIGLGASMVRVGFEDSVFYASGKVADTNAELVERIVALIHQIGYEVTTCDEAREILKIRVFQKTK
jgi:3-keto-5-aminohexanoate cleavage enzyme